MSDDYKEFMVFEIEENGERNELSIDIEELSFYLHPERALLIVREDVRRIYFWKGTKSSIRKRFLGSRIAVALQGELMENGFHRCKVVTIDQGQELEEFLNLFGLESMEAGEKLEDVKILRNTEKEKLKQQEILSSKMEISGESKLDKIQNLMEDDEKILWLKSYKGKLKKNWLKKMLKDKRYKDRVKHLEKAEEIQVEEYENRYVVTNERIIVNSIFNELYDYSNVLGTHFKIEDEIALLELEVVNSLEIEKSKDGFDVWINIEPIKNGMGVFIFEDLTEMEYNKLIDIFTTLLTFRAEVPEEIKLKYLRRKY